MRLTFDAVKMLVEPTLWGITTACYSGAELPSRGYFTKCVDAGQVWVVTADVKTVGYALCNSVLSTGPLLRSIAVLREYRGRGLGREMLDEIAEYFALNHAEKITLHCKVDNPAQKLYFDAGYRVMDRIKDYYAPEGDGLTMEKML
jgi:ribosomal protein S18 acetylase RimI-like enzyme